MPAGLLAAMPAGLPSGLPAICLLALLPACCSIFAFPYLVVLGIALLVYVASDINTTDRPLRRTLQRPVILLSNLQVSCYLLTLLYFAGFIILPVLFIFTVYHFYLPFILLFLPLVSKRLVFPFPLLYFCCVRLKIKIQFAGSRLYCLAIGGSPCLLLFSTYLFIEVSRLFLLS